MLIVVIGLEGVTAMNLPGTYRTCISQQQATWSVLVCRIVFDDCTPGHGVAGLLHADLAEDTLVNSMLRELDPSSPELLPNGGKGVHGTINRIPLQAPRIDEAVPLQDVSRVGPGHVGGE